MNKSPNRDASAGIKIRLLDWGCCYAGAGCEGFLYKIQLAMLLFKLTQMVQKSTKTPYCQAEVYSSCTISFGRFNPFM
jgi:hypothetical protein